jgi:hypothetical protein
MYVCVLEIGVVLMSENISSYAWVRTETVSNDNGISITHYYRHKK